MKWFETLLTALLGFVIREAYSVSEPKKSEGHDEKLPPCLACKTLVNSFHHGIKKTSRGKFEGGDAAWEAEKMGSYATSEVRLIEIQENLCSEVDRGKFQCQGMAETNELLFEEWWKNQEAFGDLHKWLCIEKLEVCCPKNHFGPNCTPCVGYPDNVCNNNGNCTGSGTRKGNGRCNCNKGYKGTTCELCSDSYYMSYKDDIKFLCSPCHHSCENTCSQAGPKGCIACKTGWYMNTEHGCLDTNECITQPNICKSDEFCINNEGYYSCIKCHKACKTCDGDGPDMCLECAEGYYMKDKICEDEKKRSREFTVYITRYITYFGLCVSTCIIFQKSTVLASIIGLSIALYISVSEYILANEKSNGNSEFILGNIFKTS